MNILNANAAGLDACFFPVPSSPVFFKGCFSYRVSLVRSLTAGISLGFEKEDSAVAEVEVDEVFRLCV